MPWRFGVACTFNAWTQKNKQPTELETFTPRELGRLQIVDFQTAIFGFSLLHVKQIKLKTKKYRPYSFIMMCFSFREITNFDIFLEPQMGLEANQLQWAPKIIKLMQLNNVPFVGPPFWANAHPKS